MILISSVMTWINTPKKFKKNRPKPKVEDSDIEDSKFLGKFSDESDSEALDDKVLYFTDKEF